MNDIETKLQAAQEALVAYATICPCPGIVIEPGYTSGCDGHGGVGGCPTCRAVYEAETE